MPTRLLVLFYCCAFSFIKHEYHSPALYGSPRWKGILHNPFILLTSLIHSNMWKYLLLAVSVMLLHSSLTFTRTYNLSHMHYHQFRRSFSSILHSFFHFVFSSSFTFAGIGLLLVRKCC